MGIEGVLVIDEEEHSSLAYRAIGPLLRSNHPPPHTEKVRVWPELPMRVLNKIFGKNVSIAEATTVYIRCT